MKVSLKQKDGCYYAVTNYKDGDKYKQKWEALHLKAPDQEKEALRMIKKYAARPEQPVRSHKELFCDWVEKWVKYKKDFVEISTWEGYRLYATKHIIPYFKQQKLDIRDMKPNDIQQYVLLKSKTGRCDGKPNGLSNAAIKKHILVISETLNWAVSMGIIPYSPKQKITYKKERKEIDRTFLNIDQANEMLSLFEDPQMQRVVYVVLYYGLRRSEVLGLKWNAIDFDNDTIEINHTVVKNQSIQTKDRCKTTSSYHKYQLIPNVKAILRDQYNWQQEQKKNYGDGYIDSGYVFTRDNGTFLRPDSVTRSFERTLRRSGFPVMRFHDLRHSTASILYDMGWSMKDIQLWLRHSSIEVTADIYTHISNDRKSTMAMSLNDVLFLQKSCDLLTQKNMPISQENKENPAP